MSNYFSSTANESDINIVSVSKLVPNLDDKSQYVLYYKNLQLYLSLGIKLISVCRGLNLSNLIGWRNTMILIQTKKMLPLALKKTFSYWWIIILWQDNGKFKEKNKSQTS